MHSETNEVWLEAGWQQERKMAYTSGDCEVYMKVKKGSHFLCYTGKKRLNSFID